MFRIYLAAFALAIASPASSASPFDGTWKADLSATKLDQRPEFLLLKDGIYECTACTPHLRIPADGQIHATPGRDRVDAMSATIVNARTMRVVSYKSGIKVGEFERTLSADGNSMTTVWQSKEPASDTWKTMTSRMKRVGPAPAGSFAQSGYWVPIAEDNGRDIIITFKFSNTRLTMHDNENVSYDATFGSRPVEVRGDSGVTVSVRPISKTSFEEKYFLRGRPTAVNTYRLTGPRTLTITSRNARSGFVDVYVLRKQ